MEVVIGKKIYNLQVIKSFTISRNDKMKTIKQSWEGGSVVGGTESVLYG